MAITKVQQSTTSVALFSAGGVWSPTTNALTGVTAGNLVLSLGAWWDSNRGTGAAQGIPTNSNGTFLGAGNANPTLPSAGNPPGWPVAPQIAHILSAAAGTHTVTPPVINSGGDGYHFCAEFQDAGATWTLVDSGVAFSGSNTPGAVQSLTVTTAGTLAQPGDLVVAGIVLDGNPTAFGIGAAPGYTSLLSTSTTTDNISAGWGWLVASAGGTQSAAWTWSDTATQMAHAVIAVYRTGLVLNPTTLNGVETVKRRRSMPDDLDWASAREWFDGSTLRVATWFDEDYPAPISGYVGSLAATETGSDTFAASGSVLVSGSLAATETGSDTFAASGLTAAFGSLAATETGSDTFAASGSVLVSGSLAATETGSDTFASTGLTAAFGSLAATESGADTFAASGTVGSGVTGDLIATETGSDTFAASGTVLVSGSLAATEAGSDTFAASGTVLVSGSLAASETGTDTFAATGLTAAFGALASTETGSDTFAATGSVVVAGSLAATETGADTFAASGLVVSGPIGDLIATETGSDSFAADGTVTGDVAQATGGAVGAWRAFSYAYERELTRRQAEKDRERRAREAQEDEDAERPATAAPVPHGTSEQPESGVTLDFLRELVAQAEADAAAQIESERVARAFAQAQAKQTVGALMALDRELMRLREEEEMAVLLALALDD